MRARKAIAHGRIVCTQEVERLRGIKIEGVVIALGVLEEAETLSPEGTPQWVVSRGAKRIEEGSTAWGSLREVRNLMNVRRRRCVAQVVVSPGERAVYQPAWAQAAVVANDKISRAVLQLVEIRRGGSGEGGVRTVIAVGRIAKERRFKLM